MKTVSTLAAVAALAIVVPVQAHNSTKPNPPQSHKCTPHTVAYRVGGTLVSGSLTKDAGTKNKYSGALTVHVVRADKHAKSGKGTDVIYNLAGARVHFGKG